MIRRTPLMPSRSRSSTLPGRCRSGDRADSGHHSSSFHAVRYADFMDAAERRAGGKSVWDILFGLQLGVIGGILMLIWFALISPVLGHPWWLIPNLFASHFYNSRDVLARPRHRDHCRHRCTDRDIRHCRLAERTCHAGRPTVGHRRGHRVVCILPAFLWKRIAPLLLMQAIQPILWAGYFLFGSALGWHRHLVSAVKARRATLAG